ncbi:dimethylhistidine N-methyltransferase [Ktedonobacteria bacterium brp13]|nr:dimethylhistidine N-methyltransferase [Ktedonobacteria bacterium brp13]
MQGTPQPPKLYDFAPRLNTFRTDVIQGLQRPLKELPSKYFYDEVGSQLFDQICELPEYYPTRTEISIMQRNIQHIARALGPRCMLIEYGSGSSLKTRQLLEQLQPAAYVPIDISRQHLLNTATELAQAYPDIEMLPVCADYTSNFTLPQPSVQVARRVAYYPGSTIGNFDPNAAIRFLASIAQTCGQGGGLLIGVDLKKECNILHRAYNDSEGVTAQFNLHLLERINLELSGNFQLDQFSHYAFYNPIIGRIEMHLESLRRQQVHLDGQMVAFKLGETIWTESSYKFTLEEFAQLASEAGFRIEQVWLDTQQLFSVQYLSVE